MRIRIQLITLMRIQMGIRILILFFCMDPVPNFHPDADPDPDLDSGIQIKAQVLEKVLKWAHILKNLAFHL
jgi:hypothetical protein